MIRAISSTALAMLMLAAVPANAAQARKKAEPPPPPPQFHVDVATRTVSLQKVVLSIPAGSSVGEAYFGNLPSCSSPTKTILTDDAFRGIGPKDLALVFAREATAAGYRAPGNQSNLFNTEDAAAPEVVLGAALTDLKEKGCKNLLNATTLEATLKVEWQVFDPLEKKLLFRVTNEGVSKVKLDDALGLTFGNLPMTGAQEAFRQAAKALLADPNFVAAVRDSNGGPAADPGVLFPEASAPSTRREIVRLKASIAPFKDQVAALRDQVVTVETAGGSGSGFYIADGLLLTNHHVIAGTPRVRIRFLGGREIPGEVVTSNAKRDVALIKTESAGVIGLPVRLEKPDLTSQVFVIGSPLGEKNEGSVSAGIVSAFREEKDGPFIQSDVGVTHGNSGGPMFDDKGNVIAMVVKGVEGTAVNRFIPIGDALRVLEIQFKP
ncbi:MAG: S1C family serine protease [Rhodospirillaceae bacterium]